MNDCVDSGGYVNATGSHVIEKQKTKKRKMNLRELRQRWPQMIFDGVFSILSIQKKHRVMWRRVNDATCTVYYELYIVLRLYIRVHGGHVDFDFHELRCV